MKSVLVVDDSGVNRQVLIEIICSVGHRVWEAANGYEAIALAKKTLPDIVILDVNMPGIDGYETGVELKALANDRYLPIIYITASAEEKHLIKSLSIGDDFILKPIYPQVIESKLSVHVRTLELYTTLYSQREELMDYRKYISREHALIETIFDQRSKDSLIETNNFRYHISSLSVFNGDLLLTVPSPLGGLYILIGDVTGHGLPAAVAGMPAHKTFHAMAKKGMNIGAIAREINQGLFEFLPPGMMLAATLIEVNQAGSEATIWSGGMPDSYIADDEKIVRSIRSQHVPLGVLPNHEFMQDVRCIKLKPSESIIAYTDGLLESVNEEKEQFGEERLELILNSGAKDKFETLLDAYHRHIESSSGDKAASDDLTLIELSSGCFGEMSTDLQREKTDQEAVHALPWKFAMNLTAEDLKRANPVPQITALLKNSLGLDVHQDYISTILSELFNNALEHGLLKLDSSQKDEEDGFFEYYSLRSQRLSELSEGLITIEVEYSSLIDAREITITVTDSGDGFEYTEEVGKVDQDAPFGFGMNLVAQLCHSLEYSEGGRKVSARYLLVDLDEKIVIN